MIDLRGHHLLCMLTYIGNGYSPAFVENFDAIAMRLNNRETIHLVDGPDDICAPLLCGGARSSEECHCHNESVIVRDRLAIEAISDLLGLELRPDTEFALETGQLNLLRKAFADGSTRKACHDCEWFELCTTIAVDENFARAKIK